MSILVMQTMTGTFNARAIPRCSLFTSVSDYRPSDQDQLNVLAHTNQSVVGSDH